MSRRMILSLLLAVTLIFGCAGPAFAAGGWICPACGHENPDRANFCGSCREPKPTAEIPAAAQTNAWVCSGCGEISPDSDSFCMICGQNHLETDQRALLISEREVISRQLSPAEIQELSGTFRTESEAMSLEMNPSVSGRYRVFLKTADHGFRIRAVITDAQGYSLETEYLEQGEGFSVRLEAGKRYSLNLTQHAGFGGFTMAVGKPKEWEDVSACGVISDSFGYQNQDNRYAFTPDVSGVHYLWISQAMAGFQAHILIEDGQGYSLASEYPAQGEGISISLKAGETVYVHTEQHRDLGEYQLTIGKPRPATDITGAPLVGDILTYRTERNTYQFQAPEEGDYHFRLTRADSGFQAKVTVLDQGGYELALDYLSQGEKTEAHLAAGQICTVRVDQHRGLGTYSFQVTR